RVLSGPQTTRQSFVDHNHRLRPRPVLRGEFAPSHDPNSHSLKITRPHGVESGRHLARAILPFNINIVLRKAETERDIIHKARAPYAGQGFDAFDRLSIKLLPLFFAVSQQPRVECREQRAFDFKSWIDCPRVLQTANK